MAANIDWTQVVVATLGAGGVLGGVAAIAKSRSESARTVVGAAEGAVLVQSGVIAALNAEIARLRVAYADAQRESDEYRVTVDRCEKELDEARVREHTLTATLNELRQSVDGLEQRIRELSSVPPPHHNAD